MKKLILIAFVLITTLTFSQEDKGKTVEGNKGKIYVLWGWNRGAYSNSDITFKGENYDFTLYDVEAKDKVKAFSFRDYINPTRITIPQTNFRIGYFLNDNYTISLGVDHMKYVMKNYQTVKIDGEINVGSQYDGVYNNEAILVAYSFLTFEHTDGLNYVNTEINRFDNLNKLLKINTTNFEVNLTEGVGVGVMYPRTNTKLLNKARYDQFHISGYGISAKVGLNLTFFKHFFLQSDFKYGYINMNNIRTTQSSSDSASQHFTFFERTIMLGGRFRLSN